MAEETAPAATAEAAPASAAPAPAADNAAPTTEQTNSPEQSAAPKEGEAKEPASTEPAPLKSPLADDDEDEAANADGPPDAKDAEATKYEAFTLPDGMEIDEATLANARPIFDKHKLTQEDAQELVSFHANGIKTAVESLLAEQQQGFNTLIKEWNGALATDEVLGGAKLNENLAVCKKALSELGSPELRALADEMGFAHHPHFLRLLYAAGTKLSSDSLVRADATEQVRLRPEQVLWPDLKPNGA